MFFRANRHIRKGEPLSSSNCDVLNVDFQTVEIPNGERVVGTLFALFDYKPGDFIFLSNPRETHIFGPGVTVLPCPEGIQDAWDRLWAEAQLPIDRN